MKQILRFNSIKYNLGVFFKFFFFCNGCSLLVHIDYFHPFFKTTEGVIFLFAFFHHLIKQTQPFHFVYHLRKFLYQKVNLAFTQLNFPINVFSQRVFEVVLNSVH